MKEIPLSTTSVFSVLAELPADSFTEAAYQILVLLSHRHLLPQTTADQLLDHLTLGSKEHASPEWRRRVQEPIHRIEEAEKRPLHELSDTKLRKYRKELNEMLFRKARPAKGFSDASGRAMLSLLQEAPAKEPAPAKRVRAAARAKTIRAHAEPQTRLANQARELAVSGD
jgi:hypothetical protein